VVTREQMVEQSVQDFVRDRLTANGYDESKVHMRDAFPTAQERASELTKTQLAVGFNFDDGGRKVELGSELTRRVYTIDFWTFGISPEYGRNVAGMVRAVIEDNDLLIPLKDIAQVGAPVIDQLLVLDDRGIVIQHQVAQEPRAWDRFVWSTTLKVEDYYMPSGTN
jgi:hypothetical protein